MNNLADELANKGRTSGWVFDISLIKIPGGWVDTAPVLCHQPLDYITKQVVRDKVLALTSTLKFGAFSDRWTVMIGNMFGVVLDPGSHVGKVWSLSIPEGLKEVLWKEMNGVQVLGHRYFGTGATKSDMGRLCLCSTKMSLGHILLGCDAYRLQLLMDVLKDVLGSFSLPQSFKTLHPDEWGVSPWYPLLALRELEEAAFPIVKGRKLLLKSLGKSRQHREWVIVNYYWALWKWRMKDIHDAKFKFIPHLCKGLLRQTLLAPVPHHLWMHSDDEGAGAADTTGAMKPMVTAQEGDLTMLPPPVSHIMGQRARTRPSEKGKSILRALQSPAPLGPSTQVLTSRERILCALTDDTYA